MHKVIQEYAIILFFFIFIAMGPHWRQDLKALLLPQISPKSSEFKILKYWLFPTLWNFEILTTDIQRKRILYALWTWYYFFCQSAKCETNMALWIFVNTGPCGAGSFKTLLLLQFSCDLRTLATVWGKTGNYFTRQLANF